MSAVDKELGFAELAEQLSTIHGIRQWGRSNTSCRKPH